MGLSPGRHDGRDCSLPKYNVFGWEFVFQNTGNCIKWLVSLDGTQAWEYLWLCLGQTPSQPGQQSQGMPCQLLLSWHPEGRNLVIKRMGKKQQLHDFCLQLRSQVLFPSFPLEASFHTFSALFLIKAPPHPLPLLFPIQPAILAPHFVPCWSLLHFPEGMSQGRCSGAFSLSLVIF